MKATFNIYGSFNLTGRGLVIYGDIVDGVINQNDFIIFMMEGKEIKLKIKGIDFLDNISKIGLTFYYDDDKHQESLQSLKVIKQIAIIENTEPFPQSKSS